MIEYDGRPIASQLRRAWKGARIMAGLGPDVTLHVLKHTCATLMLQNRVSAFKRTRCLIPTSGYYEWLKTETGKQPYYYTTHDGSPLTIAGLWDEWKNIETGEPLKSCTMIVTTPTILRARSMIACRCYCSRRTLTAG